MRQRIEREKELREKNFEDELLGQYLKQHSQLTKNMVEDYKREAVNSAMVEMYCSDSKYRIKNKKIIEKSKTKNKDWILLRDEHN